jgi:hypothetical protein
MTQCTEERFLSDTENHVMTVLRADGVDRHLRFRRPGTIAYGFDLLTWPGHLCITGDCGTYVFARTPDMFTFFRAEHINPGYWGEKLLSIGTNTGFREFDKEEFKERVREHFDTWWAERDDPKGRAACWEAVKDDVLNQIYDGEHNAYRAVQDFQHGKFYFQDFFDAGPTERYTFHFEWCLRAIVWGIQQHDAKCLETDSAVPPSPKPARATRASRLG